MALLHYLDEFNPHFVSDEEKLLLEDYQLLQMEVKPVKNGKSSSHLKSFLRSRNGMNTPEK